MSNDNKHESVEKLLANTDSVLYTFSKSYSYVKKIFGERLLQLRKEKELNQEIAAKALGVSRVALSYYERGERTADIGFLIKASELYNVSPNYLLGKGSRKDDDDNYTLFNQFSENVANLLIKDHRRIDFLDAVLSHKDIGQVIGLINITKHKPLVNNYEIKFFSFLLSRLLYTIIVDVAKEGYKFENLTDEERVELLSAIDEYVKTRENYNDLLMEQPESMKDKLPNIPYNMYSDLMDMDKWWDSVDTLGEQLKEIEKKLKEMLNKK